MASILLRLFSLAFNLQMVRTAAQAAAQAFVRRTAVRTATAAVATRSSSTAIALASEVPATFVSAATGGTSSIMGRLPALFDAISRGLGIGYLLSELAAWAGISIDEDQAKEMVRAVGLDPDSLVSDLTEEGLDQLIRAVREAAPNADARRVVTSMMGTSPSQTAAALLSEIQSGVETVNATLVYDRLAAMLDCHVTEVDRKMRLVEAWLDMEEDDRQNAHFLHSELRRG